MTKTYTATEVEEIVRECLGEIRMSWDIVDKDEWCIQLWVGNTLIETLDKSLGECGSVQIHNSALRHLALELSALIEQK